MPSSVERPAGAGLGDVLGAASARAAIAASRVAQSNGWARRGIAFVAGALSVLALAPFFLWPVLFLTLPVLVWLLDGASEGAPGSGWSQGSGGWHGAARYRAPFLDGWWFGFGYFAAGLFWVGEAFLVEAEIFAWLLPAAVTLLPGGLALFFGAATAAARAAWRPGLSRVLMLAVALGAAEWLRGHVLTGFPWNVLGYALTPTPVLMQAAGVLGIYGLTLWAVLIGAGPMVVLADAARRGAARRGVVLAAGLAVLPLAASYLYGTMRLAGAPEAGVVNAGVTAGVKVRIVQPSVPQRDKWRPEKQAEIFRDHLDLSRRDASGAAGELAGIALLVWPEAAMPFLPLSTPEALAAIAELVPDGTHLVTGALRIEDHVPQTGDGRRRRDAYNALMAFDTDGRLAALYDKIHLVPFGEYLPAQGLLERIGLQQLTRMRGGFSTGTSPRPLLRLPGVPEFGGLICYEAIFPARVVQGRERPHFLINVTNDGWFGNTTGPRQHFHQARLRAVEEGLPLVRAANNGISAVIDGNGRILGQIGLNVRGVVDAVVPPRRPQPLYARLGDLLFLANSVLFLIVAFLLSRRDL